MDPILLIAISVSFFCTYLVLPFWIKKAKQIGLVWEDMHKTGHPKNVAGSGGLIVVLSFILGVLIYVAITTFYLKSSGNLIEVFAITTYLTGNAWLSVIALCMVVSLFAFYIFNKCPAKVFPGDVMTYAIGSLIAIIAILGNMEKIAVFFFIPYICEVILKSRGKLEIQSFAKLNNDGSLEQPHKKIYGLKHLAVLILKKIKPSKKVYEKDVVLLINGFQIIIILLGFWLFL